MAEIRIALNSSTPSGVGNNEIVLFPTNNNGGELNVVGPDGQPKRLLTDLTTLNNITVSGSLTKTGTDTIPNIGLPIASPTNDGALSRFDKQLLDGATELKENNTLIRRDNTGGFVAGTITADLFEGPSTFTQLIPELTGAITSNGNNNVTFLSENIIDNSNIRTGASIELSKLAVNPLDRVNHTGSQTYTSISNFDTGVTNYINNNKITTSEVDSNAGILMSQLEKDPSNRVTHIGPNPASDLDDLDIEVNEIINTFLVNNPINNVQITNDTISIDKLNFDPLDRSTHTGNIPVANVNGFTTAVRNSIIEGIGISYNQSTGEISLSSAQSENFVEVSDNFSITNGDKTILASTGASGSITLILPNASQGTFKYHIKKVAGADDVTISTQSAQTIEGQSSIILSNQYSYIILQSNGTDSWLKWSA